MTTRYEEILFAAKNATEIMEAALVQCCTEQELKTIYDFCLHDLRTHERLLNVAYRKTLDELSKKQ